MDASNSLRDELTLEPTWIHANKTLNSSAGSIFDERCSTGCSTGIFNGQLKGQLNEMLNAFEDLNKSKTIYQESEIICLVRWDAAADFPQTSAYMPYSTTGQRTAECWSVDHRCFAFKQISKLTLMKLNLIESLERVCVRCMCSAERSVHSVQIIISARSIERERWTEEFTMRTLEDAALSRDFIWAFLSAMHLTDSGRLIILASMLASVLATPAESKLETESTTSSTLWASS